MAAPKKKNQCRNVLFVDMVGKGKKMKPGMMQWWSDWLQRDERIKLELGVASWYVRLFGLPLFGFAFLYNLFHSQFDILRSFKATAVLVLFVAAILALCTTAKVLWILVPNICEDFVENVRRWLSRDCKRRQTFQMEMTSKWASELNSRVEALELKIEDLNVK
ncbi:MAG: hypothetical protein K2X29_13440 [Candidatus Obscuribacterales bacterium]|nr:hypothetical protein [Candidatus Obscuribacterales bacterium]